MLGESLIDLPMTWNRLGDASLRVLIPVVFSAMPDEQASGALQFLDEIDPLHDWTESSATRRIPGMAPLVRSRQSSFSCSCKSPMVSP